MDLDGSQQTKVIPESTTQNREDKEDEGEEEVEEEVFQSGERRKTKKNTAFVWIVDRFMLTISSVSYKIQRVFESIWCLHAPHI